MAVLHPTRRPEPPAPTPDVLPLSTTAAECPGHHETTSQPWCADCSAPTHTTQPPQQSEQFQHFPIEAAAQTSDTATAPLQSLLLPLVVIYSTDRGCAGCTVPLLAVLERLVGVTAPPHRLWHLQIQELPAPSALWTVAAQTGALVVAGVLAFSQCTQTWG